jgi:hypothetical protein
MAPFAAAWASPGKTLNPNRADTDAVLMMEPPRLESSGQAALVSKKTRWSS